MFISILGHYNPNYIYFRSNRFEIKIKTFSIHILKHIEQLILYPLFFDGFREEFFNRESVKK